MNAVSPLMDRLEMYTCETTQIEAKGNAYENEMFLTVYCENLPDCLFDVFLRAYQLRSTFH